MNIEKFAEALASVIKERSEEPYLEACQVLNRIGEMLDLRFQAVPVKVDGTVSYMILDYPHGCEDERGFGLAERGEFWELTETTDD